MNITSVTGEIETRRRTRGGALRVKSGLYNGITITTFDESSKLFPCLREDMGYRDRRQRIVVGNVSVMTVITDRVPRHVCREACRISRARRDVAARRTREGRKEEGEASTRSGGNEISRSRGRNKSKIVSSMGYGSKEEKEGAGRKGKADIWKSILPMSFAETDPFEPTYFSRRQNSHCCLCS